MSAFSIREKIHANMAWIFGIFSFCVVCSWTKPTVVFVPNLKNGRVDLLAQQPLHRNFRIPLVWANDTKTGEKGWCYHDKSNGSYLLAFKNWSDPSYQNIARAAENSLPWKWQNWPAPKE
jgi:hypothetical protein